MNQSRLVSLDAFRGLTIAAMILVNNPGSWQNIYPPLRHASWHGWTPTDLVFPFFLFIVGVSVSFSLSRRVQEESVTSALYFKIVRRSILLFALGMFLRLFPFFSFQDLRIPGVLQRIAVCYLFSALMFVHAGAKGRIGLTMFLLIGYWAVMKYVPVPGYGPGIWEFEGNLCGYIDTQLLAGHLYKPTFDPEGILSTFPAIATTLLGTLTGDWLRSRMLHLTKMAGMIGIGGLFIAAGLLLHPLFPINKQLWTSTFVLFTAGVALVIFGLFYGMMDMFSFRRWAFPFLVFGTNAIAVYAGSTLMVKLVALIRVSVGGESMPVQAYIYQRLLVPWAGLLNGSLIYPLVLLLIWLAILYPLYRKKIYIRI